MEENAAVSPPKTSETTVYIFNMSEDVWPFICAFSNAKERALEIQENAYLGDRSLFTCADINNILFVLPKAVSPEFLEYYTALLDRKQVRVISPKNHSGELCRDIMQDEAIIEEFINAANGSKKLSVLTYSATEQFLELITFLKGKGLTISTPDSPEAEDGWTVNFYGSKSGIRQLAQQSGRLEPDFVMPEGVICSGVKDAAKIAAKKYLKEKGVVIKTNKGHSGSGVLLFREGDLPMEWEACEEAILKALQKDAYWDMFPIIIESFVSINPAIGGGLPNVEFQIMKNGMIQFLYYCGMRVDDKGVFKGVEIHTDVISDQIGARIVDTGFFIAEQYRASGYRGFFDVDFVAAKNGQVYVTESNVRRTGGTHLYETAAKLFGKDFMYETYSLCNNSYELDQNKTYSFSVVIETLKPILFDKITKEGVIIVSENLLRQAKLAYMIFGKTKKRAYEIEQEMESLLSQ